jgi:hypothetical protein
MGNLVVTSDMPPPSGYAGEAASRPVERREHIACPRQSWAIFSSFQRLSSELRTLNRLLKSARSRRRAQSHGHIDIFFVCVSHLFCVEFHIGDSVSSAT